MLIIHCFQHYGAISTGAASNDAASTRAVSRFEKYTLCNIHILLHGLISKAFTLFCREFENVVIHAFLVLIFWAKNAAGATVCAFCNYVSNLDKYENSKWVVGASQSDEVLVQPNPISFCLLKPNRENIAKRPR